MNRPKFDRETPWFLDQGLDSGRGQLLYGSIRRSGAMLNIAFVVLRSWWKRPLEVDVVTNGSNLVSIAVGGVSKPVLWMASVAIAGIVGSEYATSSSSISSTEHLAVWLDLALGFVFFFALYQWWKFLDRLRRVLADWVMRCNEVSALSRREGDIDLFGFTFGDAFRDRFKVRGVRFLAVLSFGGFMYVAYALGRQ